MPLIESQMRVLVTGGRDYLYRNRVFHCLSALLQTHFDLTNAMDIVVIHGACCKPGKPLELCGADRWANEWALIHEHPVLAVPAKWKAIDGKWAGPERNQRMLTIFRPTNAVAFAGGSGTRNMTDLLHKAGIVVWEPDKDLAPAIRTAPRRYS